MGKIGVYRLISADSENQLVSSTEVVYFILNETKSFVNEISVKKHLKWKCDTSLFTNLQKFWYT